MRILLVDDDSSLRAVIKRILQRELDVQVLECGNGLEALEMLTQHRIGLVILDYTMPVLNGVDTLRAIRESPVFSRMPVIMMTGAGDSGTVQRVVEYGVAEYILKPLRPARLIDRVARIMRTLEQADAPPPPGAAAVFQPLELSPDARVMIADGNREFREFFRRQVSRHCEVREADSGIAAYRSCLADPPRALFIGSELDVLSGELLAQQLRRASRTESVRLIGVMPPHLLRRAKKGSWYEAVIPRTFIADLFNDRFEALLRRPGRLSGLLALVPDLTLIGIASFEEALGSMLHAAAVPRVPTARDQAKKTCVEVRMGFRKEQIPLLVQLSAAQKALKRLSGLIATDSAGKEDSDAPLLGLVDRMAKSLLSELTHRGFEVEASEARAHSTPIHHDPEQADDAIAIEFDVAGKGVSIRLDLGLADNGDALSATGANVALSAARASR